ncbi:hypothetical protein BVC80_9073g95 [Macleaya cordata]|uniref:Voltage-gated hydrogen channel 1 n=1 Tax=Macleaya cordata TaxID=56857 RepID=A0A200PTY9_MACCD|nr:hypothetical protein BVC80_9073g95 [Macleaya cordata]
MNSSQIQDPQHPDSVIPIENIETSVDGLVRSWKRRQKWKLVFGKQQNDDHHDKKRAPWRIWLGKFLESTPIHVLSLLLLLIDLALTVLDISSTLLSCKTKKEKEENELFHWIEIVILSVLTAKVLASAVASGISFFKRPGGVIDGVVLISALILELSVKKKWAGLLVVVSLWRVVRVVESAFELSDEAIEAQIEGIQRQFEALRKENQWLRESIAEKDNKIAELEKELDQLRQ